MPNLDFSGRTLELEKLDKHLLPSSTPDPTRIPRQYAVCGMGGVGKTELVVEWVYKRMPLFQAVFWIDAAEPSQLAASYSKIIPTLQTQPPGEAEDLIANRETAKTWFFTATVPWLLIFDNADSIDLLSDYWPAGGMGSILVTSRDPFAKSFHSFSMQGLDLEPFPENEAAEFTKKMTACENTEEELQACLEMSRQLGCLPLAIIHMAGVIRRRQWTVHEFVEKYEEDVRYRSLRGTGNHPQLSRYGNTLATAWNFDDLDANALHLLRLLSVLSPDRIQERLLAAAEDDEFENAKEVLLSSSVIKRNKFSKELSIHRIIAQEIRACMPEEALLDSFREAVRLICQAWPFNDALEKRHATSRWKTCEAIFPHLEHVQKIHKTWGISDQSIELVRLLQEGGA